MFPNINESKENRSLWLTLTSYIIPDRFCLFYHFSQNSCILPQGIAIIAYFDRYAVV